MIELKNLQKIVEQHTVIDIDELIVARGEIAALVGPAGSSMQMLLDLLLGCQAPSAGKIILAGKDPCAHKAQIRQLTGVLFATKIQLSK